MGASESVDAPFDTSSNANVKINLDRDTQSYLPGDIVSGTVSIDELIKSNATVSIDLIGELGYTMNYSTSTDLVRTAYHRFPFFTVSQSPIKDQDRFELRLSDTLPPSINIDTETYPYIRYVLQVNLSRTNKQRRWIIVCPRLVIPRTNIRSLHFDAFNRKQMRMVASLNVEWMLPGDRFQFEYKIYNPNQEHIKSMNGHISMRARIKGLEYVEKVMTFVMDDVDNTTDDMITGMFPLALPVRYLPPTFSYKDPTNAFHVIVEYLFTAEVHVDGVNTSLRAAVPVMIGFEPENIKLKEPITPDQSRFSTISLHSKRHRKHRFHRFSHT